MFLDSNNPTVIYQGEEIFFSIYLIGYKKQGESLVLFLESEEGIIWSGIIDSYRLEDTNVAEKLLTQHGFGKDKKLNMACITHFHEDHATDFCNLLEKFAGEDTKIIMPSFSDKYYEADGHQSAKDVKNYIESRYSNGPGANKNTLFRDRGPDRNLIWKFNGSLHDEGHWLCIEPLLPTDAQTETYHKDDLSTHSPNELSIFLKVLFDDRQYLFTGDCTNNEMSILGPNDLCVANRRDVSYLKIPHHGSDTADSILDSIEDGSLIISGVATCAYHYRATNSEVIKKYRKCCDVVATRSLDDSIVPSYDYGLMKHSFNSYGEIIEEKVKVSGNSVRLWKIGQDV